jgi:hypothetical protein
MVNLNKYGTINHKSKFTQITNYPKLKNVMNKKVTILQGVKLLKTKSLKFFTKT